jgi:4-hydroxybenzoate polyprenyltransferase
VKILHLFAAARIKQWIKNLFVFGAPMFAGRLTLQDGQVIWQSCTAFLAFCFLSSGVYMLNDIVDRRQDRLHPVKRNRPLASGKLNVADMVWGIVLFWGASALLLTQLNSVCVYLALAYLLINLGYSFYFKCKVVVDVLLIALGFVLRVEMGGAATGIEISSWLLLCTFLLSTFLGFCKRRHELLVLDEEAETHRKILREYDPYFLDQMIAVSTASTFISYCLYTIESQFDHMEITIPLVAYGIFRYLYLVHKKDKGGDTAEVIFSDRGMIADLLIWAAVVFVLVLR